MTITEYIFITFDINYWPIIVQTLSLWDHKSVSVTFHGWVVLVSPSASFSTHFDMILLNSALLQPPQITHKLCKLFKLINKLTNYINPLKNILFIHWSAKVLTTDSAFIEKHHNNDTL